MADCACSWYRAYDCANCRRHRSDTGIGYACRSLSACSQGNYESINYFYIYMSLTFTRTFTFTFTFTFAVVYRYLAKSGPSLVQATAIVAAVLWHDDEHRSKAIAATGLLPPEGVEWGKIAL